MEKKKSSKALVICLIIAAILIAAIPFFALRDAEFGGSDDAGSQMVSEIEGKEHEAWFTPVLEQYLGREIPGEVESMLFCVQTGIGVGIIAFLMGRFYERKKWTDREEEEGEWNDSSR